MIEGGGQIIILTYQFLDQEISGTDDFELLSGDDFLLLDDSDFLLLNPP